MRRKLCVLMAIAAVILAGCGSGVIDGAILIGGSNSRAPAELTVVDVRRQTYAGTLLGVTEDALSPGLKGDYLIVRFRLTNPEDGQATARLSGSSLALSWGERYTTRMFGHGPATITLGPSESQEFEYTFELRSKGSAQGDEGPDDLLLIYRKLSLTIAEGVDLDKVLKTADVVAKLSELWSGSFDE